MSRGEDCSTHIAGVTRGPDDVWPDTPLGLMASLAAVARDGGSPDSEVSAAWYAFKESGSRSARDRLIIHYSPLVKYVASRVATGLPSSVEQADLVSYGMFGLIDALAKFDPARGIKFETYAISRIRGAIIDELRSLDWVPRSVRLKAREVERAYSDLEARNKRAPSDAEIGEVLGVTESRICQIHAKAVGQLRRNLREQAQEGE